MMLYVFAVFALLGQATLESKQAADYQTLFNTGLAEYRGGNFAIAERLLIEALAHLQNGDEAQRAKTLASLGASYTRQEEFAKAEQAYSESLAIFKRLSDKNNSALMLHNLGRVYSTQGRTDDAMRVLNQAQELIKSNPEADPAIAAELLNGIGIAHYLRGNNGKAETFFNQVLQRVSASNIRFDTSGILNNLGAVYLAQRKYKQAEEFLQRALRIKETDVGPSHPDLVTTLSSLGSFYTETRRYAEAEEQYQRSLRILDPEHSRSTPAVAHLLHALSTTYRRAGQKAESDAALEESAQIARLNLNKVPEMAAIVEEYSQMLRNRGEAKQAQELHAQANRARAVMGLIITAHSLE